MQRVLSHLRRAVDEYKLIEDGDRIAVGVSGGKDSLVLLKALAIYSKFSPQKFTIVALTCLLANQILAQFKHFVMN